MHVLVNHIASVIATKVFKKTVRRQFKHMAAKKKAAPKKKVAAKKKAAPKKKAAAKKRA